MMITRLATPNPSARATQAPAPAPPPVPQPPPEHNDHTILSRIGGTLEVGTVFGASAAIPAAAAAAFGWVGLGAGIIGSAAALSYMGGKATAHSAMPIGGLAGLVGGGIGATLSGAVGKAFGWHGAIGVAATIAVGSAALFWHISGQPNRP